MPWPKLGTTFHNIGTSCLNLAFPPFCCHCENFTTAHTPLCKECIELLCLLDSKERCQHCFCPDVNTKFCRNCEQEEKVFDQVACCFEYLGPICSLVQQFKYSNKFWLAEGLGGFMTTQFLQQNWPLPDIIVPVPIPWHRHLSRGYNQSQLLAETIGSIIKRPAKSLLKRKWGDYSQAQLSKEQRLNLNGQNIFLKNEQAVYDKTILLIDDVMTTGSTLRKSAEALMEGCPTQIFGLTLCYAT